MYCCPAMPSSRLPTPSRACRGMLERWASSLASRLPWDVESEFSSPVAVPHPPAARMVRHPLDGATHLPACSLMETLTLPALGQAATSLSRVCEPSAQIVTRAGWHHLNATACARSLEAFRFSNTNK